MATRVETYDARTEEWPELEDLGDDLWPVPTFDPALLPTAFRDHVCDVADLMQVPPDLPAVCAMACLAGAVNRRATIQPKRLDASWVVTPNLWGAMIAPPGWMKSPVMGTSTDCLSRIESRWRAEYQSEVEKYELWERARDLGERAWEQQYIAAKKKGTTLPAHPDETRTKPTLRRLVTNGPTYEALQLMFAENPAEVLLVRDELSGWLATLDKPGREGDRQFFLETWNGNKPYGVDRIGRGNVHAQAVCLSIIGGIQPGRLRQYLTDAVNGGPGDDGLFQRLQLMVWPDFPREWILVDRPANQEASGRVGQVYERLAELSADKQVRFRFEDDAEFLYGGRVAGCCYGLGLLNKSLYLAEGFATGATIFEATGEAVVVCFFAGNLQHVAEALRRKCPRAELIICADHDRKTPGNPGLSAAKAVARRFTGRAVWPVFEEDADGSDFNDLAQQIGIAGVREELRKVASREAQ